MDRETSRNLALGAYSTTLVIGMVILAVQLGVLAALLVGFIGLLILAGLSSETK